MPNSHERVFYLTWGETGCYVDHETATRVADAYSRSERGIWLTDLAGSRTHVPLDLYSGAWEVSHELQAAQRIVAVSVGRRAHDDEEEEA